MLVLIDESGCTGFKLTKGSTPYFVVAMVIFKDFSEAEKTSKTIAELRKTLRVHPEFKFNKTCPKVKDAFFEVISPFNFKIRALVVKKDHIYSTHLRDNTDRFYNYFVQMLMRHDGNTLNNAIIKIDGSGNEEFKRALTAYLRRHIGSNKIKKIKFVDSKTDSLIQLADMCAGAIGRSYNPSRQDSKLWLQKLTDMGKIEDIWNF